MFHQLKRFPRVPAATCLTIEESKALLALCRTGKLYDVERWIASGNSICTPPSVEKTPLLRKGIDGLAQLWRGNWVPISSPDIFMFRSRRATAIKILAYDGQGVLADAELTVF